MGQIKPLEKRTEPTAAHTAAELAEARVIGVNGPDYMIETATGARIPARRAAGCLLQPQVRDTILTWSNPDGAVFILNVLIRNGTENRLVLEGETLIQAESGALRLEGRLVTLAPDEEAVIAAPSVRMEGVVGQFSFHALELISRLARFRLSRITALVETMDMAVRRITARIKDCFRRVEGLDQTRAGRISQVAEDELLLRGQRTTIHGEREVKVDGQKIHLG